MSRYTLDLNDTKNGSFRVLDNGIKTEAFASRNIVFSDECEILGGIFNGGKFYNGIFNGGTFNGGIFHNGNFYNGKFYDGIFSGGNFYDGKFYDGIFSGGYLPLQIQGSMHFVNIPDGANIKIGCMTKAPDWWIANFNEIGIEEGYTPKQIIEYKNYIDLAVKIIKENK